MGVTLLPPPKERVENTCVELEMTSLNSRGQQGKEVEFHNKSISNLC